MRTSLFYRVFNLEKNFTEDPITVKSGEGIYTSSEWFLSRRKLSLFVNPSKREYIKSAYLDSSKLHSCSMLCNKYNFSKFTHLGEIGGLPFFQSILVINNNYPSIKLLLTDYDKNSLNKLKKIEFINQIATLKSFDVKTDNLNIFNLCDILIMWAVDYALTDKDLYRIFKYIKKTKKTLLIATINNKKSFFRSIIFKILSPILAIIRKKRLHGVLRSERYFKDLIVDYELKLSRILVDENYKIFEIKG